MKSLTFRITDGTGEIRLQRFGGYLGEALFIQNRPVAMSFGIAPGSIIQEFIRMGEANATKDLEEFRDVIADGLTDISLKSQMAPVLHLLEPGEYTIEFVDSVADAVDGAESELRVVEFSETDLKNTPYHDDEAYSPCDPEIVCTMPKESLDQDRIEFFKQKIQGGVYPPLILLRSNQVIWSFLIDGHHKLAAYQNKNRIPAYVMITAHDICAVSDEEVNRLLQKEELMNDFQHALERAKEFERTLGSGEFCRLSGVLGAGLLVVTFAVMINVFKFHEQHRWRPDLITSIFWIPVSLWLGAYGGLTIRRDLFKGYLCLTTGLLFLFAWFYLSFA